MKGLGALLVLANISLSATAATAQTDSRIAVSGSLGVAAGRADTSIAAGGALLFDVHDRISLEGQGTYLNRGEGANAFTVSGSVLVNLVPAGEAVVPYGAIGAGVHHISFDLDRPRFLGSPGAQFPPGSGVCPAPGSGFGPGPGPGFGSGTAACGGNTGYWGVGVLPHFFARRLGVLSFPQGSAWGSRDFTDPVVNVGGGVRFNVTDRLMLRPDARALIIVNDGETHTVGVFVLHVGYRF